MDYRTNKPIVVVKPGNPNVRELNGIKAGLRLRVLDANHVSNSTGARCLLVQKETADSPMAGLFSIGHDRVEPAQ